MRRFRPTAALAGLLVVLLVVVGGCSDAGDDGDSASTTSATAQPATSVANPEPTTTTTAAPLPPPASVLPPPVTEPGASASAITCTSLGQALPVADLLPRDLGSWPDERQRVVVDARLNASLYEQAAGGAPESLLGPLTALRLFSTFVADSAQSAADVASALAAIDGYPQQGEVAAATVEVDRWVRVNCP